MEQIIQSLDKIAMAVAAIIGIGGVASRWLLKAKVKQIIEKSEHMLETINIYQKYDADHLWTESEYQEFGKHMVLTVKNIEPLIKKIRKWF